MNNSFLHKAFYGTLYSASALSVAPMLYVGAAHGQTVSAATTSTQAMGAGQALTVTSSGSITVANPSISVANLLADSITNQGSVSAATTAILINGAAGGLTGGINNSGTITVNGSVIRGYGINHRGTLGIGGNITNSGTIDVSGTGTSVAQYYGVYADKPITGSVTNSGTIRSYVDDPAGYARADGIFLLGSTVGGGIINDGTIHSENAGFSGRAYNHYITSDIGGDLINNGTISGQTSNDIGGWSQIYNYLLSSNNIGGDLINNGVIDNDITAAGTSNYINSNGIYGVTLNGSLVNSGTISGTFTDAGTAGWMGGGYAYISSASSISGEIINNSNIILSAVGGTNISLFAHVIRNNSTIGGVLNNGVITQSAVNTVLNETYTYNFYSGAMVNGNIVNNGSLVSMLSAPSGSNYASGYYFSAATLNGDLVNNGSITYNTSGTTVQNSLSHINFNSAVVISGDISNAGNIDIDVSSASGSQDLYIVGVNNSTVTGDIINTGSITVDVTGASALVDLDYAALWGGATMSGDMENSGSITANIADGTSIDARIYSLENDLSGSITNSGTISVDINSPLATTGAGSGVRVASAAQVSGGVVNSGTLDINIDAGSVSAVGINVTNAGSDIAGLGVVNSGTITASSSYGGSGIVVQDSGDISGGINNSGRISANRGIYVLNAEVSGGITNTGTLVGTGGTAIALTGLTGNTPIALNGGTVTGDIIDDTPANGFSPVTVGGTFTSGGDITVSTLDVGASGDFTISSTDTVSLTSALGNAGILRGTGSISGGLNNTGSVAPGNSIGTLTIAGNYTQGAGATLEVELDGAGNSDLLDITGTATLDGTVSFSGYGSGGMSVGDIYTFIQTTGGVVGSFAQVLDSFLFVDIGNVQVVGNDVQAEVIARSSFGSITDKDNQTNVASTLDNIVSSGQAAGIDLILNSMNSFAEVNNLLSSQANVIKTTAVDATSSALGKTNDIVRSRFSPLLRSTSKTQDQGKLTGMAAGDAIIKPTRKPNKFWVQAIAGIGDVDADSQARGSEYDTFGVAMGGEKDLIGSGTKVGAFVAHAETSSSIDGLGDKGEVNVYQVGVYGGHNLNKRTHVNASLSGAYLEFDTMRPTPNSAAKAAFDGYSVSGYSEISYDMYERELFTLSPYVGIEASYVHHDAYTEKDAGLLNLSVDESDQTRIASEVGVQFVTDALVNDRWHVGSSTRLGWVHDYADTNASSNASFETVPTVKHRGESPDRGNDSAHLKLDLTATQLETGASLYGSYDLNVSPTSKDHLLKLGAKWSWE